MKASAADLDVRPLTRVLRALADETRVRIVALLGQGELCVCHLESALALGQSNVSRHLGILKAAGVVDGRRAGSWVYYRLVPQATPEVQAVLDAVAHRPGARRGLRTELDRIKRACGPQACK